MNSPSPYKRLPGLGQQLATHTRLYLGPDHLLQVSTAAFTERYKRFYFRDIQAILLVRTQTWIWWNAGFGGVGALALFIAVLAEDAVAIWIFAVLGGLLLAGALVSALRGPSCHCYIRTAVQTERLPSLNRVGRADKVLTTLKPLIDAVQGSMSAAAPVTSGGPANEEPGATDRITIVPPEESTTTAP